MKKKCNNGGPIESTKVFIKTQPYDSSFNKLPSFNPFTDIDLANEAQTKFDILNATLMMKTSNSNKAKSNTKRFREKSLGGDIIQTGLSFIPGVGQILAPLAGMIDQKLSAEEIEALKPPEKMNMNLNPFGKLANGGFINDGFTQYNTGSHKSGKDLVVGQDGLPDPNGESSVQNKENSYKIGNRHYVMSDVLKNPKTGNTFNIDAASVNKKYPDARLQPDQRAALDFEMKELAALNDSERLKVDMKNKKQKAYGGYTDNGDPVIPPSENIMWPAQSVFPTTLPTFEPVQSLGTTPIPQETGLPINTTSFGNTLNVGQNITTDYVPDRGELDILNPKKKKASNILGPNTANAIGLGLKGAALIGSISDALRSPEKEELIKPDYSKSDNYLQAANIDYTQARQDAQGVSNIAAGTNRSLSSNVASFQGREQARLAGLSDQLGRIAEQQNLAQSNLNLTKGQIENSRAVDLTNRKYQNQQGNMQNQANARYADRVLSSDLASIGSSFNSYAESQKMIKNQKELNQFKTSQTLAILGNKYPNFKLDPQIVDKFKNGEIDLDQFLQYVPSEIQSDIKANI